MNIGAKVTLRGERMYVFLDKLFNIVLPRIRDFRGLSRKSFDGRGNYNMGLREQLVFPEINFDKVDKARGMDIVIVTSAKNDEEATAFLESMGLPLQKAPGERRREGELMAKTSSIEKSKLKPKFSVRAHNRCKRLRPAARLPAEVRHVPHLLPRKRAPRVHPGRHQGVVVREQTMGVITDPIADLLTRIRNANTANHQTVDIPASRMKKAVAQILVDEGFIAGIEEVKKARKATLRITPQVRPGERKSHHRAAAHLAPRAARLHHQDRDPARSGRLGLGHHVDVQGHHVGQARQARRLRR